MNAENLLYLPKRTKVLALALLISALFFSGFVTIYYLFWVDVESTFVLAALSVFQITSTGAAIAIVAFSSKSSFGREALLRETSKWLTIDFVETLETIDLPFDPKSENWSSTKKIEKYSKVDVRVDHIEGTASAYYEICAFNTRIMMRITLNSYRFIVLLYADEVADKDQDDFRAALEIVTSGAEHVGFQTRVAKHAAQWAPLTNLNEAYFIREVSKDFLYNGTERLFWAQDIATLTRSAIIQLKRNGWLPELTE